MSLIRIGAASVCILVVSWSAGCAEHVGTPGSGEQGSAGAASSLHCCPANFDLYSCNLREGGTGLACHNPAMGCPSSETCGEGCDQVVSGRCECIQNVLCVRGSHFDRTLCKCVPDDTTSTCVQNVLCIRGAHFDRTQCKCVPDETGDAGTAACNTATDCRGLLPAICEQCPGDNTACAHFACVAGQCQIAICE